MRLLIATMTARRSMQTDDRRAGSGNRRNVEDKRMIGMKSREQRTPGSASTETEAGRRQAIPARVSPARQVIAATITRLFRAGIIGGGALLAYFLAIRPRVRRWGATDAEAERMMPGDDEVPEPLLFWTTAITIAAPPEAIWPWLAQLGQGRGGFYSYEWIENLMGLNIHNAKHILPEYQDLKSGDGISFGRGVTVPVKTVQPNRLLLLAAHGAGMGEGSWVFTLEPVDATHTRLVTRSRAHFAVTPALLPMIALLDPGAMIMMRAMLRGIKQRVEAA